jgi:NAD(P)-dependent dehydrogenase (short-subunit alcohol dehydrogenase family)
MRVVITGSSHGIGRALAERLIRHGDDVWGLARSSHNLDVKGGGTFKSQCCDVADWAQVESAASEIAETWPSADALVTCAGIHGEVGRTFDVHPLKWRETVQVNLVGTFNAVRAFANLLSRTQRRTKIVCFAGGGATKARPYFSAYGAAKTAVVRLIETIAAEERTRPLDINAVAPGAINTRLTEEVISYGPERVGKAEYDAALIQKATGGASLDRALDLVVWLLSPQSDGISGKLLSAQWDPWPTLESEEGQSKESDIYTLRRVLPKNPAEREPNPPS